MLRLQQAQIEICLPHRDRLLLISGAEVQEWVPDGAPVSKHLFEDDLVNAWWDIPADSWCVEGHFPENPIVPGVLILEALAQACGILARAYDPGCRRQPVLLVSMNNARFKFPVRVPNRVVLLPKVRKIRGAVWQFAAVARVGDNEVASVELLAQIAPTEYKTV